jgi:hypothetical protein
MDFRSKLFVVQPSYFLVTNICHEPACRQAGTQIFAFTKASKPAKHGKRTKK